MAEEITKISSVPSYEAYKEAQQRKVQQELGKNDFLSLLSAQLRYQDPMEPVKDSDFVAQLAQFSSLEQMTQLNETMSLFQYYSLAGKYVYGEAVFDDGVTRPVSGVVDRVINTNGEAYVQIGENIVKASVISQVYDKDLFTSGNPLLSNAFIIGRTVKAAVPEETVNEAGETISQTIEYEGTVTRIAVNENSVMTAYLDSGVAVPLGTIYDIS
jgi:flagellar basal-body rod modification protein FlgD